MNTTGWITVTIFLTFLAILLQIAGYVAPMWIWIDVNSFRVGVGLWISTGCGLSDTCNTTSPTVAYTYGTDHMYSRPEYNAVRGLETVGLACAVLLLLFLIVYRIGYNRWDRIGQLNVASFLLCVLAWVTIGAGLIVFCAFFWPIVGTSPLISSISFPWSLIMCLAAAILLVVICILIRTKCRRADYSKNAIPTSGDAKIDLNPVTKSGMLNRYFAPSPYSDRGMISARALSSYYDEGTTIPSLDRRLLSPEAYQATNTELSGQSRELAQSEAVYNDLAHNRYQQSSASPGQLADGHAADLVGTHVVYHGRETAHHGYAQGLQVPYVVQPSDGDYAEVRRVNHSTTRPNVTHGNDLIVGHDPSKDGRLIATASPLSNEIHIERGGIIKSQVVANSSGLMQNLPRDGKHMNITHGTWLTSDDNIKGYDDTYIYRPYSEDQIY